MAIPAKAASRARNPEPELSVVENAAARPPARRTATKLSVVGPKPTAQSTLQKWAMAALETSRANNFLCSADWTVIYANQKAKDILAFMEPNLHNFHDSWKSFHAEDIIGSNLDFLFTDEPREFRLASDPRNHPYQKNIKTGPCVCDIQVTSLRDDKGELVGYSVDWERITDKLAQEARVKQLMTTLDSSTANTFLCDLDMTIAYANKKSFDILEFMEPNLHKFSDSWRSFRAKDVVGTSLDFLFTDEPEHYRKAKDPRNHPYHCQIRTGPCVCEVTVTSTKNDNGEVTGYAIYWERITDKIEADRRIQEQIEEKVYLSAKIDEMMGATQAIARGDLTQRIPVEKDDAIGKLATAFNDMTTTLTRMAEAADSIASGDLSVQVKPQSEKDMLGNAFEKMINNLSELVAQARNSAETIVISASEVSTGTDDLSQRTEEQASSLEETASSMEEMTSTVKQNADNARQANQLAAQAREVAEKGGLVVSSAVASMEEINKASRRIADIISVIDEIAFQTNLLALNAAVEAARVGEQGRGFAVVAAEVRNLAGRSATAAKEIKALVQDSAQKVQEGSNLVNQSGHTLEEIVSSVKKVADIIAEISAASQEQSAGIEQVNKAIMQMDQITQQNAALVEEAAAASQAMSQQAMELREVVGQFTLDAAYAAVAAPVPVRAMAPAPSRSAGNRPALASVTPTRPRPAFAPMTASRPRPMPSTSRDDSGFEEF